MAEPLRRRRRGKKGAAACSPPRSAPPASPSWASPSSEGKAAGRCAAADVPSSGAAPVASFFAPSPSREGADSASASFSYPSAAPRATPAPPPRPPRAPPLPTPSLASSTALRRRKRRPRQPQAAPAPGPSSASPSRRTAAPAPAPAVSSPSRPTGVRARVAPAASATDLGLDDAFGEGAPPAAAPKRRRVDAAGAAPPRAATERMRLDNLAYVLDGLGQAQPLAVRRRSAERLAELLADPDARRLARSRGGIARAFRDMRGAHADPELAYAAAVSSRLACRSVRGLARLPPDCAPVLVDLASGALEPLAPARYVPEALAPLRALLDDTELPGGRPGLAAAPVLAAASLAEAAAADDDGFRGAVFRQGLVRPLLAVLADDLLSGVPFADGDARAWRAGSLLTAAEHLSHAGPALQEEMLTFEGEGGADLVGAMLAVVREGARRPPADDDAPGQSRLLAACRVLVNLTHQNDRACAQLNGGGYGVRVVYSLLLAASARLPALFDVYALVYGVLINCAEHSEESRRQLLAEPLPGSPGPLEHVAGVFAAHHTRPGGGGGGGDGDGDGDDQGAVPEGELEDRIVSSYSALLLACLVRDSPEACARLRAMLPGRTLAPLVGVVKEFVLLQSDAGVLTEDNLASVLGMLALLQNHEDAAKAGAGAGHDADKATNQQ